MMEKIIMQIQMPPMRIQGFRLLLILKLSAIRTRTNAVDIFIVYVFIHHRIFLFY